MMKNYSTVILVFVFGVLLTFVAAKVSVSFEEEFFQRTFNQRADNHTAAIHQGLQLVKIQSKQFLNQIRTKLTMDDQGELSPRYFKVMAGQLRKDFPVLRDFIWIKTEHESQVETMFPLDTQDPELFVSLADYSLFHSTIAGQEDLYLPLKRLLHQAFQFPQEYLVVLHDKDGSAFHVLPLFDRLEDGNDSTVLLGILLIHWHLGDAVESAIHLFPKSGLDFEVRHLDQVDDGSQVDYKHVSRTRSIGENNDAQRTFSHDNQFDITEDTWQLTYHSAPAFIVQHPLTMFWPIMAAGMVMTFLVCLIILLLARQNSAVQRLVEKKTTELKESEERYKLMIEHMPLGIAVHKQGLIEYLNPFFLQLTGHKTLAEVVGKPALHYVHPDDHQVVIEDAQRALQGEDNISSIPVRYTTPDGARKEHEMLASHTHIVTGGEVSSVTIALDMTAQNKANRALADQHKTMEAILDAAPMGIWMVNPSGHVQFLNDAFAVSVNQSKEDLLSASCYKDLLPDVVAKQIRDSDKACLHEAALSHSVERYPNKEGIEQTYEIVKVPLFQPNGSLLGIVGLSLDITSRLAAEKEKEQTQKQAEDAQRLESLGVLAGGIAHDFNNLLSVILGNANLATHKLGNHTDIGVYLARIEQASESAASLCNQMLAYAGQGKFAVKQLDLTAVVREMARLLEVSLLKTVHISYALSEVESTIEVDAVQLQQVIMNLITNANEAMEEHGGVIRLRTGTLGVSESLPNIVGSESIALGNYAFIEVADTGCGMAEDVQNKVFDPFFTTKFTGRGLGLSAMLGMVRSHGGFIQLCSKEGEGSVFSVFFPLLDQAVARVVLADVAQEDHGFQWHRCGKVLVVDDEEVVLETTDLLLQDLGFDTLIAHDGEHGLEVFQQHQDEICLVVMDLTMPRMDGRECALEILKLKPDVQVVMCSGYSEEETLSQCASLKLSGFLQKPVRFSSLKQILEDIAASSNPNG